MLRDVIFAALERKSEKNQNYIRFDFGKHKYPIRSSEEKGEL
jgi:hypothetical protein